MLLIIPMLLVAGLMVLIGIISADSARKSIILFFVCALWVGLGIKIADPPLRMCFFAEAGVGFLAWLCCVLMKLRDGSKPDPEASDRPTL